MLEKELMDKFNKIKGVVISENYLGINTKEKFFSVDVKTLLKIFDYLLLRGYTYVGELGIDCNKFVFQKINSRR